VSIAPFVDAAWLTRRLDAVVLADVRWYLDGRSGEEAFAAAHLPGAVYVSVDRDLAAPASPEHGRHPLPAPEDFAAAMSALGIGDGALTVAYDDAAGTIAARLAWMLRALGEQAAVLDGGLQAWDGELESGPPTARERARFTPRPWPPARLAAMAEIAAAVRARAGRLEGVVAAGAPTGGDAQPPTMVLLDARERSRYRGELEPIDPRAGHIPTARSFPAKENLDQRGRVLAPEVLAKRLAELGVGPGSDVVCYCGSGITACHDLLVLERAGLGPGRLYPGSWSQWSADPQRPAAKGD
jgi:thiosulfate/3-mercaptopyruvate sulfurtransferase